MKYIFKEYLKLSSKGIFIGFFMFLSLTIGYLGISAFDWLGVSNVISGQKLTSSMYNSSMNTITGSIQVLQDNMLDKSSNQVIAGLKNFSNFVSGVNPVLSSHITTKQYVDSKVLAASCPTCPSCNCTAGGWQSIQVWGSCNGLVNGHGCIPSVPSCPSGWTNLGQNGWFRSGGFSFSGDTWGLRNDFRTCVRWN